MIELASLERVEYLQQVAGDAVLLATELQQSNGFIMEKFKLHGIKPPLDILMNNLNSYTIEFIVHHYTLEKEQQDTINKFLSDNSHFKPSVAGLCAQEIEEYLQHGLVLPGNTILTVNVLNRWHEQLMQQYDLEDNHIEKILKNSLAPLSPQEVMTIRPEILFDHWEIVVNKPGLFHERTIKYQYKDIIVEVAKQKGLSLYAEQFSNWPFEIEDRDFLYELISSQGKYYREKSYDDLKRQLQGFTALISKEDFFLKINSRSIEHFTLPEIKQHKTMIADAWLQECTHKEFKSYKIFNHLSSMKASFEQFIEVVDESFLLRLIERHTYLAESMGSDSHNENGAKLYYLCFKTLEAIANEKTLPSGQLLGHHLGMYTLFNLMELTWENNFDRLPTTRLLKKDNKDHIEKIFSSFLPLMFANHHFGEMLNDRLFNIGKPEFLDSLFNSTTCINAFFLLVEKYGEFSRKENLHLQEGVIKKKIEPLLVALSQRLLEQESDAQQKASHIYSMRLILERLPPTDPLHQQLSTMLPAQGGLLNKPLAHEGNFLAYESQDVASIHEKLWPALSLLRPSFMGDVLHSKTVAPLHFIHFCLHNSHIDEYTDFLKQYVDAHRPSIEQDDALCAEFLRNAKQEIIFPISLQKQQAIVEELKLLWPQYAKLDLMTKELGKHLECKYKLSFLKHHRRDLGLEEIDIATFNEDEAFCLETSSREDAMLRHVDLYQKKQWLGKKIDKLKSSISSVFLEQLIDEATRVKDWTLLNYVNTHQMLSKQMATLAKHVNAYGYEELVGCLKEPGFCSLLVQELSGRRGLIEWKDFTAQQNYHLLGMLLPHFESRYDDGSYANYAFKLFAPQSRGFLKQFLIDNCPDKIFHDYHFRVDGPDSLINPPYTHEEILQAFMAQEKKSGLFVGMSSRKHEDFFREYFFSIDCSSEEEKRRQMEKYLEFLEFAKGCNAKLYALACACAVHQHMLAYGATVEPVIGREQALHDFFCQHVNLATCVQGFKELIMDEKIGESHSRKFLAPLINSFIWTTFYEELKQDQNAPEVYRSQLSSEDTLKIFSMLHQHAPACLLPHSRLGNASDMVDFFKTNIQSFNKLADIENFIFASNNDINEYLNLDEGSIAHRNLTGFFTALVEDAIENHHAATVQYFAYLIKHQDFATKQLNSRSRNKACTKDQLFVNILANCAPIRQLLSAANMKFAIEEKLPEAVIKKSPRRKL